MKNYMLFDDGTMNILVDGVTQRRKYSVTRDEFTRAQIVQPEHGEHECVMRYISGEVEIVTIGEPS